MEVDEGAAHHHLAPPSNDPTGELTQGGAVHVDSPDP
jgi:hypothetical protein